MISACLLGEKTRYNGSDALYESEILDKWKGEGKIISFCPEMLAGFSVPRAPSEILNGTGRDVLEGKASVIKNDGSDVSTMFIEGARLALRLAQTHNVRTAVLKERSPSCGSSMKYDGTFTHTLIPGAGVTTSLLRQHGIAVFSENQLKEAEEYLSSLEEDNCTDFQPR
jgi:uncharacterized protein YbbK (DUF523 family)